MKVQAPGRRSLHVGLDLMMGDELPYLMMGDELDDGRRPFTPA